MQERLAPSGPLGYTNGECPLHELQPCHEASPLPALRLSSLTSSLREEYPLKTSPLRL